MTPTPEVLAKAEQIVSDLLHSHDTEEDVRIIALALTDAYRQGRAVCPDCKKMAREIERLCTDNMNAEENLNIAVEKCSLIERVTWEAALIIAHDHCAHLPALSSQAVDFPGCGCLACSVEADLRARAVAQQETP